MRWTVLAALVATVIAQPVAFATPYTETDQTQELQRILQAREPVDTNSYYVASSSRLKTRLSNTPTVPEPGTAALMALGLVMLGLRRPRGGR